MVLPSPKLEKYGRFWVVRDDLITGGTKCRALLRILKNLDAPVAAYAADRLGYGPVALAEATHLLGMKATIVFPNMETPSMTYRTVRAMPHVTAIIRADAETQNDAYALAQTMAEVADAHLFPIGFDTPEFIDALTAVTKDIDLVPHEIWSLAGSGCLTRALQQAWPQSEIHAVSMGFPQTKTGNAIVHFPEEAANEPARDAPPYPSALFYDAKVWRVANSLGGDNALIWNVS